MLVNPPLSGVWGHSAPEEKCCDFNMLMKHYGDCFGYKSELHLLFVVSADSATFTFTCVLQ